MNTLSRHIHTELFIRSIFAWIFLSAFGFCYSQSAGQKLYFTQIKEGLVQSTVNAIHQDSYGFIWIGTMGGLHRYEGTDITLYEHLRSDPNSLANNEVSDIVEDLNGNLWVSTINTLNRYDRETNQFIHYDEYDFDPDSSLNSIYINDLHVDAQGQLWIGISSVNNSCKLIRYQEENDSFVLYKPCPEGKGSENDVNRVFEARDGTLWLGTLSCGLLKYNSNNQEFEQFKFNEAQGKINLSIRHQPIAQDNEGNIWVGTMGDGLLRIDSLSDGQIYFQQFLSDPNDPGSVSDNTIIDLLFDSKGRLWVGTEHGGLDRYHPESNSFSHNIQESYNPNSISSNSLQRLFEDKQGRLWVGTFDKGLNVWDPHALKFKAFKQTPYNSLSLGNVTCFLEDGDKGIWIGTDGGGLDYFDRESRTFTNFSPIPGDPSSLSSDAILCLHRDSRGLIWVGTWEGGINVINNKGQVLYKYSKEKGNLSSNYIFDIKTDKKGKLYIASFLGGLDIYDEASASFQNIAFEENKPSGLGSAYLERVFCDSKGDVWISVMNSGLDKLQWDEQGKPYFLHFKPKVNDTNSISDLKVHHIYEASDNTLWISTYNGLNHFDPQTGVFKSYFKEDGLPNNAIAGVLEDTRGQLWVSTYNGFCRFNPETAQFHSFNINDGLQSLEFNRGACYQLPTGEMLFGGRGGFNIFHPDSVRLNSDLPQVYITKLKIFNQEVPINEPGSPLQKNILLTDKVTLNHKQSVITLEFIALNYTNPDNDEYAYMLKGFDKQWNYIGHNNNATYTNLDPGSYEFQVMATNNDGIWNEEPTILEIRVLAPYWKTLWFRIVAVFVFLAGFFAWYYIRMNNIRRRNILLSKMVEERTQEIKQKNKMLEDQAEALSETNVILEERQQQIEEQTEELKAQAEELYSTNVLLKQKNVEILTQRDELKKLNDTKDKFFSIVAHDLKNPFNTVLGFAELFTLKINKLDDEKRSHYAHLILKSAQQVYQLLENLLNWSRVQMGRIKFMPRRFDLSELCMENVDLIQTMAKEKGIEVVNLVKEGTQVYADYEMINTVIRNLLTNALKFTQEGKVELSAQMENGNVKCSIIDSGIGMDKETMSKLFLISNKDSRQGTAGEEGTGLGLILCKEFVVKNGGEINCTSQVGQGSSFSFTLPNDNICEIQP